MMTPAEFTLALDSLTSATRTLISLPLEEMQQYVDRVETLGALPENNMTERRAETTAHVGRMVSAAIHMRTAVAMGGRDV